MASTDRVRARRTAPAVRREQLVRAAVPVFAARGDGDAELREIADAVGVRPNLIHHYFPGGKDELHLEAVRLACGELGGLLDVRDEVPLDRKMPSNIGLYLDQILAPTPAYVLYARSSRSADDAVRATAEDMREEIAAGIARNHLGAGRPPARVLAALTGYVAFAETTAEQWRERKLGDRARLERLLADVLASTVASASRR